MTSDFLTDFDLERYRRRSLGIIGITGRSDLDLNPVNSLLKPLLNGNFSGSLAYRDPGIAGCLLICQCSLPLVGECDHLGYRQLLRCFLHCGILDVQYFTKLFKKEIGITPSAYRIAKFGQKEI